MKRIRKGYLICCVYMILAAISSCTYSAPIVPAESHSEILIENIPTDLTVDYQLLLFKGLVSEGAESIIVVHNEQESYFPVVNDHFKAMVLLHEGENHIEVIAGGHKSCFITARYEPRKTDKKVQLVYIVARDGDGSFETPPSEPNDLESALDRIRTGGLLLQSATAEMMYDAGFGRKTFQLVTDDLGQVDVRILKTSLTMEQSHSMAGLQLWNHFRYKEFPVQYPDDNGNITYLAFMSMTRFSPEKNRALAHTALGADRMALIGTGTLHTWAQNLAEVPNRLADTRVVSDYNLFDDSAYRDTFWANYATSLGASLHELGHAFGLLHSGDRNGIMERGFDRINRIFMLREDGFTFPAEQVRWSRISAQRLAKSPWFNTDKSQIDSAQASGNMKTGS